MLTGNVYQLSISAPGSSNSRHEPPHRYNSRWTRDLAMMRQRSLRIAERQRRASSFRSRWIRCVYHLGSNSSGHRLSHPRGSPHRSVKRHRFKLVANEPLPRAGYFPLPEHNLDMAKTRQTTVHSGRIAPANPTPCGGPVVSQYARRNQQRLSSLQAAIPVLSLYPSTAVRCGQSYAIVCPGGVACADCVPAPLLMVIHTGTPISPCFTADCTRLKISCAAVGSHETMRRSSASRPK